MTSVHMQVGMTAELWGRGLVTYELRGSPFATEGCACKASTQNGQGWLVCSPWVVESRARCGRGSAVGPTAGSARCERQAQADIKHEGGAGEDAVLLS